MNDPREAVRESVQNLVQISTEREEIIQRFAVVNESLDMARQQHFMSIVDLLNTESLKVLKDTEFFEYVLSGFLSWKNYESTQQHELQGILERSIFGTSEDAPAQEADKILQYSGIDLTTSMNIEKALNNVLALLGFQLSVIHSVQTLRDGTRSMGLVLAAEIRNTALFLEKAEEYVEIFHAFSELVKYGDQKMRSEGIGSFSFLIMITENHEQTDPNMLPVLSAEDPESPFDSMTGETEISWKLYRTAQDMAKERTYDFYPSLKQAVQGLERLQNSI